MDTTILVSDLIDDGRRIIEQLPQDGFEVTTAFWVKKSGNGEWYFYVVSPVAQRGHLRDAYAQLFTLIQRMPEPHWIDPLEVRLLEPSDPMAKDVLAIYNSAQTPKASPIRRNWTKLGNVSVEETYLYPLAAAVSG